MTGQTATIDRGALPARRSRVSGTSGGGWTPFRSEPGPDLSRALRPIRPPGWVGRLSFGEECFT